MSKLENAESYAETTNFIRENPKKCESRNKMICVLIFSLATVLTVSLAAGFIRRTATPGNAANTNYPILADGSLMKQKLHGTCVAKVQQVKLVKYRRTHFEILGHKTF